MLSQTPHLSDQDIQVILQTTNPATGRKTLSQQQFKKLYDASNRRIALVREHRFKQDCTLFRLARLLQSLTVFKTLSPDNSHEIIEQILHGLPFHYLSTEKSAGTESCKDNHLYLTRIPGKEEKSSNNQEETRSNNLEERTKRIVALHDKLANRINHALGNTKSTPKFHLANLYNLGHAELLYRHRYNKPLNQPDIEQQLNNIQLVLEQDLTIDGLKEKGKPGLAAEIFNPEQKQYSVSEHTHNGTTALHIIEIEKFHPYETTDLEHTTLPTELLNDYLFIQKYFQPGQNYTVVPANNAIKPVWLEDLADYEQYYIVADLHEIGKEVVELMPTELHNDNQEFAKRFRKRVDEKYSNTSAKGRQYPGLASLRRETRYIYLKNANGSYTLEKKIEPHKEHFTSAGCPNPLRTHNRDEDKAAHIQYSAKNIASRLPHLIQQRIEWLRETFGPGFNLDNIKIHFNIVSLLSPIDNTSNLANFFASLISRNESDRLRENNEERIVEVLDGAVQYLKDLQQLTNQAESNLAEPNPEGLGRLVQLNSALATTAIQEKIRQKFSDINIGNITIDFGLSVFGINKMGRGRTPLSNIGATGPAAGFKALADDCALFDSNWGQFCNTQGVTLDVPLKEQLKDIISNTQHILRSPNLTSVQLTNWRDRLNNFLNSDQAENLGNGLEQLKELARKISAATAYLQTDLPLENARTHKAQSTCFEACKKTIKAAIFEKMLDKQAFLFACKSHHDRAEHRVAIANAIDIAEVLLGKFPNPSKPEHFELIIKCFIKEKFFVQSLSRARALSTNNIALKSHDSFALDSAPEWVQGLIDACATEIGIDREQCPYNDITPEETSKALEKMNFKRMLGAFYSEGILGDFLEAPTPLPEGTTITPLSQRTTTHPTICDKTADGIEENPPPNPGDFRRNSSESSHASSLSSLWAALSSILWGGRKSSASSSLSNSTNVDNNGGAPSQYNSSSSWWPKLAWFCGGTKNSATSSRSNSMNVDHGDVTPSQCSSSRSCWPKFSWFCGGGKYSASHNTTNTSEGNSVTSPLLSNRDD